MSFYSKIQFALLTIFLIVTTSLFAQNWGWQSPNPPPLQYNDVHIINGDTAIAVTQEGDLVWTYDSGNTWMIDPFSETIGTPFYAVHFLNDNIGIATGSTGSGNKSLIRTTDGGQTWEHDASFPYVVDRLRDVQMTSEQVAYAAGENGRVYKSTNGGSTWNYSELGSSSNFMALHFFDDNRGFVAGESGNLFSTSDGGTTWSKIDIGSYRDIFHIEFVNDTLGFIGARGQIFRTEDGGTNWTQADISSSRYFRTITFSNENDGYAIGSPEYSTGYASITHDLFRTNDGGLTWTEENPKFSGLIYTSGKFSAANHISMGSDGSYNVSFDGGATFSEPAFRENLTEIASYDRQTFLAYNLLGDILLTKNGGETWDTVPAPETSTGLVLRSMYFLDKETIFVSADSETFYKSTDSGQNWQTVNLGLNTKFRAIDFSDKNNGYAVGSGNIYRTIDGADTWNMVQDAGFDLYFVKTNGDSTIIAGGGSSKLFTSFDKGESWTPVTGAVSGYLNNADFADELNGAIAGWNGKVYFTEDGGHSWTETSLPRNSHVDEISYVLPDYVIVKAGVYYYSSSDKGQTWETLDIFPNKMKNFYFADRLKAIAVGDKGRILSTENGFGYTTNLPESIEVVAGGDTTAPVNTILNPYTIVVKDGSGNPVEGVAVSFRLTSAPEGTKDYSLSTRTKLSDENGEVSSTFKVGNTPGTYVVTASVSGLTNSPATFTITAEAADISDIVIVSGNNQNAFVGETLSNPFIVRVIDSEGEGVPEVKLTYTVTNSPENSGSFSLLHSTTTTDQTGIAENNFTLGNMAGEYMVEVKIEDQPNYSATFTASAALLTGNVFDWDLLSPTPQPNTLETVYASDANTAIAAGEFGTVIKTTDGGNSWTVTHLLSGKDVTFYNMDFVGNNGWIVGENGQVLKTNNEGSDWYPLSSGTNENLDGIFFLDANIGWISGANGTLLKTTNGGSTWSDQSLSRDFNVSSLFFISEDVGFAGLRNPESPYSTISNPLYMTQDGGDTWAPATFPVDRNINDIFFLDSSTGWITTMGLIYVTTDGGSTWNSQTNVLHTDFMNIHFQDENSGWVIAANNNLYTTTNGGETWVEEGQLPVPAGNVRSASFNSANNFMIVGTRGLIMNSTDSGESWTAVSNHSIVSGNTDVHFTSNTKGYMVKGNSYVYITDDAGANWEEFDTSVDAGIGRTLGIRRIHFSDENNGWAVTSIGDVLKTTDGGENWTIDTSVIPGESNRVLHALFSPNQNTVFIGGGFAQTRHLKRTTDGGNTWTDLSNNGVNDVVLDLFFIDMNTGWAVTKYAVFETTDGGDTWTAITEFELENNYRQVFFTDANVGYVINDGKLLRTENGGDSWEQTELDSGFIAADVHFSDANNGWVSGNGIWSTSDGGQTWQRNRVQTSSNLNNVFALSETNIWVFGKEGALFRSKDAIITSSEDLVNGDVPTQFSLEQNYPNPFNPTTNINFSMAEAGTVKLTVYNVLGQQVSTLISGKRFNVGQHTVTFDAGNLSSGMYLYRIEVHGSNNSGFTKTARMVLVK